LFDERLGVFETVDSYILESVDRDMPVVGWGEIIGGMAIFEVTFELIGKFSRGMVGIKTDRR